MKNQYYDTWGERGENIKDPVYVQQPDDHSCALRSQQIVLRDFGIDIPFDKLEELAKEYGVYTDEGTYTYDIGKVLELAGVGMHQVEGSTLLDLTNELAQGHRVIVSVDAHELWYNDTMGGKLKNWFSDVIGNQGGNHALIVAGVEVNPSNPKDVKVVLTDPGAGDLRVEYPLEQFMDAWKDSNCFMAATDNAAPYQYDVTTHMEIPSNFVVQQYVNDFVISNGYQLSPDLINIPQGYQPAFSGHLDTVGRMDYETFQTSYNDMLNGRIPSSFTIKEQIEALAKNSFARETTGSVGETAGSVGESDGSVGETTGSVGETTGSVGETDGSVGEYGEGSDYDAIENNSTNDDDNTDNVENDSVSEDIFEDDDVSE